MGTREKECIEWQGATDSRGNPKLGNRSARRVRWVLTHGEIESGSIVRACPLSRLCVNSDHLMVQVREGGSAGPPRKWKDPVKLGCQVERETKKLLDDQDESYGEVVDRAIRALLAPGLRDSMPDSQSSP